MFGQDSREPFGVPRSDSVANSLDDTDILIVILFLRTLIKEPLASMVSLILNNIESHIITSLIYRN